MADRTTTRSFNAETKVWSGWYNESPGQKVECPLWMLCIIRPENEEVPEKASDKVAKEIAARNQTAFETAKAAAVAMIDSLPDPVINAMSDGIGRVVGDKFNTTKKESLDDKLTDVRDTWSAYQVGESVSRGGVDPAELAMINLVSQRLVEVFGESKGKAEKNAKDNRATSIARLARKRGMPVAEYRGKLEAHVEAQSDL